MYLLQLIVTLMMAAVGPGLEPNRLPDLAAAAATPIDRGVDAKIDRYAELGAETLDPRVQRALKRIPHRSRRILAMKYYMRRRHQLEDRWAMSAKEIRRYQRSKEFAEAMKHIANVIRTFEEQNPGYSLRVNTAVRSLEAQTASWNRVASVGRTARELMEQLRDTMADSTWAEVPTAVDVARFETYLRQTETENAPTVAVPGYSLHGTGRAFDFKVVRRGRVVAGISTRTVAENWDTPGWTEKLKAAVAAASDRFDGPLEDPYEPWHYEYHSK